MAEELIESSLPVDLEEAQRRIAAAIQALSESAWYMVLPPAQIDFSVEKPDGWRRHEVVCYMGNKRMIVERFWSWDRADDLCIRLNRIGRLS